MAMPGAGAHPAFGGDDDGDRLINHLDLGHSFLLGLNQRSPWVFGGVAEGFGIAFDFFDHQAAQRGGRADDLF